MGLENYEDGNEHRERWLAHIQAYVDTNTNTMLMITGAVER
jgi:hypothetical protein